MNWEVAKISALSSSKIDKHEYLTGEEILPSDQSKIIEPPKFASSRLGKALEKQIKTIKDAAEKQTKTVEGKVMRQLLDTDEKSMARFFLKRFFIWRSCIWIK